MKIFSIAFTFAILFGGMIYLAEHSSVPSPVQQVVSDECQMTHSSTEPNPTEHGKSWIGHLGAELLPTMGPNYVAWNTNVFGILADGLAYTYEVEGLQCIHTYTMGKCDIVIDYNCY